MKVSEIMVIPLWHTEDALKQIEKAGRTCYKSESKITNTSAEKFVERLIKNGHEAMVEHAVASFRVICSRSVTHELVRHRLASYAQESTRYVRYKKDMEAIRVPFKNASSLEIWIEAMKNAEDSYHRLLENGEKPEIAREVLPLSLKTEIVVTCNFREWRTILKLRGSKHAHPMIRDVAKQVYVWFLENYPVIVTDIDI